VNIRADGPVPASVDWAAVRRSRYEMILKLANSIFDRPLVLEDLDHFEARGALTLNFFLPDRTPAFSIIATDAKPLFERGRWTPIRFRTSHPDLIDAVRRTAEEYHRQTKMPASVQTAFEDA
jgi:hypothetical protein